MAKEKSGEQIQGAVSEALRRIVYGLLLWREGSFRFLAGEPVWAR